MTDPDERLSELLSDAVSDIEPGSGLDSIRSRTKVTPMTSRRPWLYATGGAVLATAAVITAIALASGNLGLTNADPSPGPAGSPTATSASDPTEPDPTSDPTASQITVAGYYLGDAPRGVRLYREFTLVAANDPLDAALLALVQTPADPDYSTPWPDGAFLDASFDGIGDDGVISVVVDPGLHDRPAGMTEVEAQAAIQQVVYTLQAATQTRAPVQFRTEANPIDQVYGVPTSEPLTNAHVLDTLSLMSITSPAEGEVVSGSFVASGVNNGYEAAYGWEIRQGDLVVASGFGMAAGAYEEKLFPWETEPIDVSELAPGTYTFAAFNDDPSDGEGNGPDTDTRTIVVE